MLRQYYAETIIISGGIDSIQKHNIKSNIYHSNWNEKENKKLSLNKHNNNIVVTVKER